MANPTKDKIKYSILKVIDVSGFKVLDPPVRLLFKEEPQKQIRDISRYMLLPIVFVFACLAAWTVLGPSHKTKSGEVPTPTKVWDAWKDSYRFHEKESEKEQAFMTTGEDRGAEVEKIEALIQKQEGEYAALEADSQSIAAQAKEKMESEIAPIKAEYDELKALSFSQKKERKSAEEALAQKVANKTAEPQQLVTLIKENGIKSESEKEELKLIKTKIDLIRSNPPKEVKAAQLAANKLADEIQHSKKRIDYLTSGNREVKGDTLLAKAAGASTQLNTTTDGGEAYKQAKSLVSNTEKAEKTKGQQYPRSASIVWQTYRSLITVIIGFSLACLVAIPLGIMCGLNRIVMACLTPIISIFRPVSPVVWLLIFQIIIGAFFPDPEKHPLFLFLNDQANPLSYFQTNPAMIFSACTVAVCALWPALVNTALGVSSIDPDHLNVAKVLRLGFWSRLFKIIIPSSLPLVFAGLRISLGVGWMVLIAAEALSSSDGLGKFVWDEYQNGSSQSFANIIVACFVVGIIGFFLDRVMIVLQRLVSFDESASL